MDTPIKITYIETGKLREHPDNPRKALGDLSELTASIKEQGIMQNLTVVPFYSPVNKKEVKDLYTVVIGHRRLAAARRAGLSEVPCVIASMTPEEQIATMLAENIQRASLTPYEEAQGFQQLQMDFGKSVQQIAQMSGVGEATVRSRLKLAKLDGKKVEKGCERGATLFDFAELDKVKDPETKEKCLDVIGTSNFRNTLKTALEEQKAQENLEKIRVTVSGYAKELTEQPDTAWETLSDGSKVERTVLRGQPTKRVDYIEAIWAKQSLNNLPIPGDAEKKKYYFYVMQRNRILIYREHEENTAEEARKQREAQERAAWTEHTEKVKAVIQKHYELRQEFIRDFGGAKSQKDTILRYAPEILFRFHEQEEFPDMYEVEQAYKRMIGPLSDGLHPFSSLLVADAKRLPEKSLLAWLFATTDSPHTGYMEKEWIAGNVSHYEWKYKDNPLLNTLYFLLDALGYQQSDEEKQMRRGTHPLMN